MSALGDLISRGRGLAVRAATDREARIVLIFSLFSIAGGFLGNRLLTQVASPDALGRYYLFANLAQWLSMPAAGGYIYVTHHWPIAREHGETRRFARALWISIGGLTIACAAGAFAMAKSGRMDLDGAGVTALVGLLALGTVVFQLLSPIPSAERWRGWSGALNLMGGTARPFVQAGGIMLLGLSAGAGLLGSAVILQVAAGICAASVFALVYRRTLSPLPPRHTEQLSVGAFLTYSLPALMGVFAAQAASSIERWGLARSQDTAATALFVQAMGMSVAVTGALNGVLMNYYYPFATNAAARDTANPLGAASSILKQFYAVLGAALLGVTLVVALFVRPITSLAFGAQYSAIARLLPWTVAGASLFAFGSALTIALYVARDALWPNLARIASQVLYALALIFLPRGADPAGVFVREYLGSQCIFAAIVCFAIFRVIRARQGPREATSA